MGKVEVRRKEGRGGKVGRFCYITCTTLAT